LDLKGKTEQKNHFIRRLRLVIPIRLLVKCGIAACGMRRVKCGMECAEIYCGTVGNNVLTINSLRYAGLQRQGKRAYCCTLFIVCCLLYCGLPFTFPGTSVCSLISQRHLVSWCIRLLDNSPIRQLADCQLADWTTRGLVNSRTRQLVYWTSRGLDNSRMPSATLRA